MEMHATYEVSVSKQMIEKMNSSIWNDIEGEEDDIAVKKGKVVPIAKSGNFNVQ